MRLHGTYLTKSTAFLLFRGELDLEEHSWEGLRKVSRSGTQGISRMGEAPPSMVVSVGHLVANTVLRTTGLEEYPRDLKTAKTWVR